MTTGLPACAPATPAARAGSRARTEVDLDVVIVSYRCRDLVQQTLAALEAAGEGLALSVHLVDNASGDGTVESVRAGFPKVDVVANGANAGFAAASNTGLRRGHGRHVLLLNPDTRPAPGSLRTLVAFADAHPQAGVVAPRLVHPDGTDQRTARSFPTPAAAVLGRRSPLTRLFPGNRWSAAYLAAARQSATDPFRVDWVSGAAMLVPRPVVDMVGALDDGFFLFWEDADWCRRIADAGLQVWCVPAARVVHDEGGTRGHGWSTTTIRSFHQGAYRYWVKHHAPSPWDPRRWLAALLLTARAAVLVVHHSRPRRRPAGAAPSTEEPA